MTPAAFCGLFDTWKAGFPDSLYKSYLFGRDGAYTTPKVDGKQYVLRHVHLLPVMDPDALAEWNKRYKLGTEKGKWKERVSNRALIYATRVLYDSTQEHLLMYILDEPDAHRIARMKSQGDRVFMEQFATCAAAFIHNGEVIF